MHGLNSKEVVINREKYGTNIINIGKRKTGGGGTGSLSADPLGGLTGSNSQDYTG